MKKYGKSTKKGFTLVELIVVLVILAVLAAMLVPALTGYIKRAQQEKDYQAASAVYAAAQAALTEKYGKGDTSVVWGTASTLSATNPDATDTVIDLAGVDPARVTAYSFHYNERLVIDYGSVEIKSSGKATTYYLYTDGSWGPTSGTNGVKPSV